VKRYDFSLDIPIASGSLEKALDRELGADRPGWARVALSISFFAGIGAAILFAVAG
jgi:hypothetical protein